jgi:hypothetical protein
MPETNKLNFDYLLIDAIRFSIILENYFVLILSNARNVLILRYYFNLVTHFFWIVKLHRTCHTDQQYSMYSTSFNQKSIYSYFRSMYSTRIHCIRKIFETYFLCDEVGISKCKF